MTNINSPSKLVYEYLGGDAKASQIMGRLPEAIKRKMVTDFTATQVSGDYKIKKATKDTILDAERYESLAPHDLAKAYPEEAHKLIINDIVFDVLPSQIKMQDEEHLLSNPVLRGGVPIKTSTGRTVNSFMLQIPFVGNADTNQKLRRLIAQARILPIWYIDNEIIRQKISPDNETKNMAVVCNSINVTSHPEAVNMVIASITLEKFNWQVYSDRFHFSGLDDFELDEKYIANSHSLFKTSSVKSPLSSPMYKAYWDAILAGDKNITLSDNGRGRSFMYFPRNAHYTFKEMDFNTSTSAPLKISYYIYKSVPVEVIQSLMNQKVETNTTDNSILRDSPSQSTVSTSLNSRLLKIQGNIQAGTTGISGTVTPINLTLNSFPAKLLYNKAKEIGLGKPYYTLQHLKQGIDKTKTLSLLDCSSLVYHSLRLLGLGSIGTWTTSQYSNIQKDGNGSLVAAFTDFRQANKSTIKMQGRYNPEKEDLSGALGFHFKDVLPANKPKLISEGRLILNKNGREVYVAHISLIGEVNDTGLKMVHALTSGTKETSAAGLGEGFVYHEIWKLGNLNYSTEFFSQQKDNFINYVNKYADTWLKDRAPVIKANLQQQLQKVLEKANQGNPQFTYGTGKTTKEIQVQLYETSKMFMSKYISALNEWLKRQQKDWELIWTRDNQILLRKKVTLEINSDVSNKSTEYGSRKNHGPVVTYTSCTMANHFARVPMQSHNDVVHQWLGGSDSEAIVQIQSVGNHFLGQLNMIREYCKNARKVFRRVSDVGLLEIEEPVINLCGSKYFVIDSIQEETVADSPELYNVVIHLSEQRADQKDIEQITQEFDYPANIKFKFIETLMKDSKPLDFYFGIGGDFISDRNSIYSSCSFNLVKYFGNQFSAVRPFAKNEFISLPSVFRRVLEQENIFPTRESLLRFVVVSLYTQLLGYLQYLGPILGITQEDWLTWAKLSDHLGYVPGLFDKMTYEFYGMNKGALSTDENNFASTHVIEKRYIGNSKNVQKYFPTLENFTTVEKKIDIIFKEAVISKKRLFNLPLDIGFTGSLASAWVSALDNLSNVFLLPTIKVAEFLGILQSIGFDNAEEYFSRLNGTEFSQISGLISYYIDQNKNITRSADLTDASINLKSGNKYLNLNANIQLTNVDVLTKEEQARKLQLKAKVVLSVVLDQFRNTLASLADVGIDKLKYAPGFKDFLPKVNDDNVALYGLPSYQDIPVPYLDLTPKDSQQIRESLAKFDVPPKFYLNPDFLFHNRGDELNTGTLQAAVEKGLSEFNKSYQLIHQFGMLPLEAGQARPGSLQFSGGHAYTQNALKKVGVTADAENRNTSIPDTLRFSNLLEPINRVFENKYINKNKTGRFGQGGDTTTNPTPYNSSNSFELDYVAFGSSAILEPRLAVQKHRDPQSLLPYFTQAMSRRSSSPFRLRRAMPAFKLYFIEDDTSGLFGLDPKSYKRSYDDFFSYSAIKEIKYVSSRKVPAAMLIIRLSNLYGNLDNLQFTNSIYDEDSPLSPKTSERAIESLLGTNSNTSKENPFARFILKEGIRVQFRGDNENNPGMMNKTFNGQIVQINQEGGDEITIVCQSFATQLAADVKGPEKTSIKNTWIDTFELLSSMICQPEMTYFGRWQLNQAQSIGESRSTGGWEKVFSFMKDPKDDNIFAPSREDMISQFSDTKGGLLSGMLQVVKDTYRGVFNTRTVDIGGNKINIKYLQSYAGGKKASYLIEIPALVLDKQGGLTTNKGLTTSNGSDKKMQPLKYIIPEYSRGDSKLLDYQVYRTKVWDIFKEMELRHPGWIGHPVPYGNRMTMFFGLPTQIYWSRPPSLYELQKLNDQSSKMANLLNMNKQYLEAQKNIASISKSSAYELNKVGVGEKLLSWGWFLFEAGSWIGAILAIPKTFGASLAARGAIAAGTRVTFSLLGKTILKEIAANGLGTTLKTYGASVLGGAAKALILGSGGKYYNPIISNFSHGLGATAGLLAKGLSGASVIRNVGAGSLVAGALLTSAGSKAQLQILAYSKIQSTIQSRLASELFKREIEGRAVPFRKYHHVTSSHHIVANSIKSSNHEVYNAVALEYTKDSELDDKYIGGPDTTKTKVLKASYRIQDKDLKMGFFSYPNCRGDWMADRYAQGLLLTYMKDAYKGSLLVLGDWNIDVYDRILIEDDYMGMYGQIEVEQVVTTLSPDVGHLTEITPDLVMYGNNIVDLPYDNYMSIHLAWEDTTWAEAINTALKGSGEDFLQKVKDKREESKKKFNVATAYATGSGPTTLLSTITGAAVGAGVGGPLGALIGAGVGAGAVGIGISPELGNTLSYFKYKVFGSLGIKFYEWTTSRQPIIFEPLFLNGKPMLPMIDMDKVSMVQSIKDGYMPVVGNLARGFDALSNIGRQMMLGNFSEQLASKQFERKE